MNALNIKNLSKSYKSFALKDISLTLPCGCIMGLIGENGAGKSTTIKCILGMAHTDGGSIELLGREVKGDMRDIKEDIGVVLDEVGLPDFFTAKHVNNVMKHTYRNWDEAEFFRLQKKFALPENKQFREFSRGMKMKMGIAIAMSHKSKMLILDEATSGLDPVARDEVVDMINEFTRDAGHSALISSHIVSDLEKLCDYIVFLHDGRVLLCEEKDKLLAEYGMIHCSNEELKRIAPSAIVHKKENSYGIEALIKRDFVPADISVSPISVEELFIFMCKELGNEGTVIKRDLLG